MTAVRTACGRCGAEVAGTMRFCPACGTGLQVVPSKGYAWIGGVAVLVFSSAYFLQTTLQNPSLRVAGKASATAPSDASLEPDASDPQLVALRREIESSPGDIGKLRVLAGVLGDKIRRNPHPPAPPALAFEAIDVLSRILSVEPKDAGALVLMADVSFDQKALTKAREFYERYLAIEPTDLGARARYASTLTLLGRFDDSIKELQKVLAKDPKNFPAVAYVAFTYHQKGDYKKAREFGTKALAIAPSEEARARFSGFMAKLAETEATNRASGTTSVAAVPASSSQSVLGVEGLVSSVKANPIAGPKFVEHEAVGTTKIRLIFRDFPMQMMPPFAKDKFLSGIKKKTEEAGLTDIREIEFVDQASGATMEKLSLS